MRFDHVLVGGGLQNALIALALARHQPGLRVAMVEAGATFGGNHRWSFHASDVDEEAWAWVEPLVDARWDGYEVRFPNLRRTFDGAYCSTSSERMHARVSAAFASRPDWWASFGRRAVEVGAHDVLLDDGTRLEGASVIDARGPARRADARTGYQKFVGLELALRTPHALERPILIDAEVPQSDGFHFVYVLPLTNVRVLVEDTYFSDSPQLDLAATRAALLAGAVRYGLDVASVAFIEREEVGSLPLPLHAAFDPKPVGPLVAGYAGGWFHPTTGYSFPVAVRLATHVATNRPNDLFGPSFRKLVDAHARQVRFATLLNRLLFGACTPAHRRDVLERFHHLPEPTIRRFYAATTTAADRARIVCGRPPRGVSLRRALVQMVSP